MDSFRSQSRSDDSQPLFYSPALPSELLWYIIHHCTYPTTLIVCSSRLEFLTALAMDAKRSQQLDGESKEQQQQEERGERNTPPPQPDQSTTMSSETQQQREEEAQESGSHHTRPSQQQHQQQQQQQQQQAAQSSQDQPPIINTTSKTTSSVPIAGPGPGPSTSRLLLASPLYQIAVARHVRTVFVPTVSHLRAFLSVFDTNNSDNKIPGPPPSSYGLGPGGQTGTDGGGSPQQQLLLVYGLLSLHRDSSEWSVQGLNNTLSVLLEAGRRVGLQVVVVEPIEYGESIRGMDNLLGEKMPVVSGSALKAAGEHLERSIGGGGLMGKTVDVRRVLGRWFRFGVGGWESLRR